MCNWLIAERKKQSLTQQALASKVGVTRQMITAIESGGATPSVKVAKAIAVALGIDWTAFYNKPTQISINKGGEAT